MVNRLEVLSRLESEYTGCRRCPLHASRNKLVHWRGSPDARLFIIGEAPGADEDAAGVPFVGPAGRKLDEALEMAGVDRSEQVFIANVVACRPPGSRNPARGEIRECAPRLHSMLELVKPKVVVLMGSVASKMAGVVLFNSWRGAVTEMELVVASGKIRRWTAICTWHPAYILRSGVDEPAMTRTFASDIRKAHNMAMG